MSHKVLLTLAGDDVSARFDLTTEVLIAVFAENGAVESQRTVVMPQASAEDLCHLIVVEGVQSVVCGGIEEEFHQYLTWKRVEVLDSVMGPWQDALDLLRARLLRREANLFRGRAEARPEA